MSSHTVGRGPGSSLFLYPAHGLRVIGIPGTAGRYSAVFNSAHCQASVPLSARTMIGSGSSSSISGLRARLGVSFQIRTGLLPLDVWPRYSVLILPNLLN